MAKEIIWSPKAQLSFHRVIKYLTKNWTEREVRSFVQKSYSLIQLISKGKVKFRKSESKGIYEVPITKHNLLLYKFNEKRVELLLFFDTRQHPKKKLK
jgi:plasmid stabilization system protein ParE